MTRLGAALALILACACDAQTAWRSAFGPSSGLAVVMSDYRSTSVSLVAPGAPMRASCIDSGTQAPRLSLALSGDVVLPSQPLLNGTVLLIDRDNAALLFIEPTTCSVLQQLQVSATGSASPHDALSLGPHKLYVARYGRADGDEGDDIGIVDPQSGHTMGRVRMTPYALPARDGTPTLARPTSLVRAGSVVFVALANESVDFAAAGPGRIVMLDVATDAILGTLDIPDYTNCLRLAVDAEQTTLAVACAGPYTHVDAALSGVALFALQPTPRRLPLRLDAKALADQPLNPDTLVVSPLGLFVATVGDTLWHLPAISPAVALRLSATPYIFSGLLTDSQGTLLLLANADPQNPAVLSLDASGNTLATFPAPGGLPPRQLGWY